MKPNIITIDKKKFLKLLAASNVGYVSSLYDRTAVKRALDQATVTALNEDEYYRNKFTNSKLREEPTPEPEECEHDWYSQSVGEVCFRCGIDKPKSKVPEKLSGEPSNDIIFRNMFKKINELVTYLKEKENE